MTAAIAAGTGCGERITPVHLLNVGSGLAWAEAVTTCSTAANDKTRLWWDAAPWRYILEREVPWDA